MDLSAILNTVLALLAAFAAGASIAVLGNSVGKKTGKRKLSVFGLRPKHTATLITLVTGGMIAVVTLLISLALSGQMAVIRGELINMRAEIAELREEAEQLRKRQLVVAANQILAFEGVDPGLSEERVRALVESALRTAEAAVRQRYYTLIAATGGTPVEPKGALLAYDPRLLRSTIATLQSANLPQAVQIQVAENVVVDGRNMNPVPITLSAVSVFRVYHEGDVVARASFDPQDPELISKLVSFVYEGVPNAARRMRMPPNPLSGEINVRVGSGSALDWSTPLYRALSSARGPVEVQARAARDLYSLGRLDLYLEAPALEVRVPPVDRGAIPAPGPDLPFPTGAD